MDETGDADVEQKTFQDSPRRQRFRHPCRRVGPSIGWSWLGANVLGSGKATLFCLRALGTEAGTGLNVAAGVSRLQLRQAG
ncbi:DUF992 domain-containing protein [Rhizobium populisoli]|uniref:DUF992 domain-containing protein n=1 Tax=Rhizobium populisoli TaxID=2859785 RepID=UPI0035E462B1